MQASGQFFSRIEDEIQDIFWIEGRGFGKLALW